MDNTGTLFASGKCCYYCGTDPGRKPRNSHLFNGFHDLELNIYVGYCCRDRHYYGKWRTEYKGLYSETPVMLEP